MIKEKLSVLVLDDDPVIRNFLRSVLKEKLDVFAVETPSVAYKILRNEKIDIMICDFRLPETDGLTVIEKVRESYPDIAVVMISSAGNMDIVIKALRNGASDFVKKPFNADEIWVAIERTRKLNELSTNLNSLKMKTSVLKQEVDRHRESNIVGKSQQIRNIKNQMQMLASTPDTSVLIIGESGTGKELVARGIHDMSNRRDEVFCAVNMSAVPESLFESEFFGHKKGSFTGAISDKAGWFETANNGTLFLDEIGEMSLPLQVKLLRVLEDRKFTMIGTQQEKKFNIRIIAATNKSIEELASGKNFRLDLYHRLSTFIIEMPSLRERFSDIPDLTNYFVRSLANKLGKQITGVDDRVYDMLKAYSFPGNIRELKNILERATILCGSETIQPEHIMNIRSNASEEKELSEIADTYDLGELEKRTIVRALRKVNYNKAEAARLLNLEWNALYRRIIKFNIPMPSSLS